MMALSIKTSILMDQSGQDSFTADEIVELMTKATGLCIAETKEMDKREEKKKCFHR